MCVVVCCRAYIAHCSHVMDIRFSPNNRWVLSMGGKDRTAMQWRVLPEAADEIIQDKPQVCACSFHFIIFYLFHFDMCAGTCGLLSSSPDDIPSNWLRPLEQA